MRRKAAAAIAIVVALSAISESARAQDLGAARLRRLVSGLTVTPRVLVIGARPGDDEGRLVAWLARGRMVETGVLSLTRGESALNLLGTEAGTTLGALRTEEVLASRRIDGGEQFFTRAYDFGFSRNAAEAFKRWPHDSILGDIVTVIRSFRPHVIVAAVTDSFPTNDGQDQALAALAREAFNAAADTTGQYTSKRFGVPWTPLKLYFDGKGLIIDPNELDIVAGETYNDIAARSRAARRSEGLDEAVLGRVGTVRLQRVASRVNDTTPPGNERSIFDGVDTSFARLDVSASSEFHDLISLIRASADSARAALDLQRPSTVALLLGRVVQLATSLRNRLPFCSHPAIDAAPPAGAVAACSPTALDLDASADLVRRRAIDAFLAASGVSFDATLDRELLADGDTAVATVNVYNYGTRPVTVTDVTVSEGLITSKPPSVIQPGKSAHFYRTVAGLPSSEPWWIGEGKTAWMFPRQRSSPDGVARPPSLVELLTIPGVAVPETIRRLSDVSVTLSIDSTTVTTSVGPLTRQVASPTLGVQTRAVAGSPPVTIELEHPLEWIPAHKAINRALRVTIRSYSDATQNFTLHAFTPKNLKQLRVDSLPPRLALQPHESRDIFIRLRGQVDPGRVVFGLYGVPVKPGLSDDRVPSSTEALTSAFQTIQYPHVPAIRLYHSSGMWLEGVDIAVAKQMNVVYVKGVPDDVPSALKEVGAPTFVVPAEDLLSTSLTGITAIVIGRGAYEMHPELVAQNERLMDFVRQGGTLVVEQEGFDGISANVLPYPIALKRMTPERVSAPDAPVSILERTSRLVTWPNTIRDDDWNKWVSDRAVFVPSTADSHYSTPIEMHDPEQPANKNTILEARVGKGVVIYTTITFDQQIQGGVPGALRLFVNLLSASAPKSQP